MNTFLWAWLSFSYNYLLYFCNKPMIHTFYFQKPFLVLPSPAVYCNIYLFTQKVHVHNSKIILTPVPASDPFPRRVINRNIFPSRFTDKVEPPLSRVEMAINVHPQHSKQLTHEYTRHCLPHRHDWMQHKVYASVHFFIWKARVVAHRAATD